uniref:Alpha-1,3-mannosyl-glycoprotein 2-beta-N-acetylglucosaminyltransferase n=1 Tax=Panagrolaimus superbus TaxID=310955 RepID=A0A914Z3E7_9BILA
MNLFQRFFIVVTFLVLFTFCWLLLRGDRGRDKELEYQRDSEKFVLLTDEIERLQRLLEYERKKLQAVESRVDEYIKDNRDISQNSKTTNWNEPIGILVFVCNRAEALRQHIQKLLNYRKSAKLFPIYVSQDCDDEAVAEVAKSFGEQITYIKHISGANANIVIPPNHKQYTSYYRISRHYKLGLSHVFDNQKLGSVIITEDDLDIAPDFFDYFSATRWLLDADKSLYCVSGWNDNGKENLTDVTAKTLLYRSDFFSGLGWLMTKALWNELGPQWPTGFWDDWIRDPARRLNRSCIRPEVPRTAMTMFGKSGASKGLFFKHLKQIKLNETPANFSQINLSYLLKNNYDDPFMNLVYGLPKLTLDETILKTLQTTNTGESVRIEYSSMQEYTNAARKLHIMIDTKAGVGRTAYRGIVTCFINGLRIYLAPSNPKEWKGYDVGWQPPAETSEQ